jgi:hypothetical protein
MTVRIGYKASAEQFTARQLVDFTVQAERLGFDSAFISDHFQPWRHTGGHAPFALAWIAAAGERTSRLVLGTSVMTPHYRYNPAVIAQAFGTLGSLFPNRVVLGVGSGEALNEIATGWQGACDQSWPDFKERFARAPRGHRFHEGTLGRRTRQLRWRLLLHARCIDLRPPRHTRPHLCRSRRSRRCEVRGPGRRGIHLHLRQGHGARSDAPILVAHGSLERFSRAAPASSEKPRTN